MFPHRDWPNMNEHSEDVRQEYKELLIINESRDAKVTLFIYSVWLPFSVSSKKIQPKTKCIHRETKRFKFKLVANFDDERKKKELFGRVEWVRHTLVRVTESLACIKENLSASSQERQIALRKMYLKKELTSTSGKVNLYDLLGLDMIDVRKLSIDDQRKAIKKAFNGQIKIWHPDKNFGDDEIAGQIILAKETLLDDGRRACYHNETDYDKGWFSRKRLKAIFWPDCYTVEQNNAYWRRIGFMFASFGLVVGGLVFTALTAGGAAPVLALCGEIFEGGLTGAGMISGYHTISKDAVVNGCDAKKWVAKAGIGFLGGALAGGAAAGITAGVFDIGSAALESGAVSFGQYAEIRAVSGSVEGVGTSLASDAARRFVDGEEVTWKDCFGHAIAGALTGSATEAVGCLVTKGIVNRQTTAGSAALEGEMVEQAVLLTEE